MPNAADHFFSYLDDSGAAMGVGVAVTAVPCLAYPVAYSRRVTRDLAAEDAPRHPLTRPDVDPASLPLACVDCGAVTAIPPRCAACFGERKRAGRDPWEGARKRS